MNFNPFFQIEWKISRLERSGQVSLHDVTLDADMISSLEHCPVEWNVTLGNYHLDRNSHTFLRQTCNIFVNFRCI
jgi:hypothetical protein